MNLVHTIKCQFFDLPPVPVVINHSVKSYSLAKQLINEMCFLENVIYWEYTVSEEKRFFLQIGIVLVFHQYRITGSC